MNTQTKGAISQEGTTSQAQVPSQMKGLLLEEYKETYVYRDDIPVPQLEPGMLLIRVKVVGFCHTDLMVMSGEYPAALPIVPGHETVGVVAAVADGVTEFKIGDRVGTLLFRGGCNKCRECLRGTPEYCSQTQLAGLNSQGGMAQYLLADPAWTVHLPEAMEFAKAAPLMCAGATVYHSLLRCGVSRALGEGGNGKGLIGIVGIGGLGHLAVQFAKSMGYNVVAIDIRSAPLELCKSLPEHLQPDVFLNPNEITVQEMLKRITMTFEEAVYSPTPQRSQDISAQQQKTTLPVTGLDAVLVCTDSIQGYLTGIELLAKHGTLVYVGQPEKPVPMHWGAFVTRDITVIAGCLPCGRWGAVGLGERSGLNDRGSRMDGGMKEQRMWMSARDVMHDMVELVERVGLHVEVSEYQLENMAGMIKEFGGEGMKGKIALRIEDD